VSEYGEVGGEGEVKRCRKKRLCRMSRRPRLIEK
jgi:hypothetical protein